MQHIQAPVREKRSDPTAACGYVGELVPYAYEPVCPACVNAVILAWGEAQGAIKRMNKVLRNVDDSHGVLFLRYDDPLTWSVIDGTDDEDVSS